MKYFTKEIVIIAVFFLILAGLLFSFDTFTGFTIKETGEYEFLELPEILMVERGQENFFDIDFEEGYRFSDNTDLFEIEENSGEFSFISEELGEFNVVFVALKDVDNFYFRLIRFQVVE